MAAPAAHLLTAGGSSKKYQNRMPHTIYAVAKSAGAILPAQPIHHNHRRVPDMGNNPNDLKASGLKATLPRLKILDIFQSSPVRHLTAEDVYKVLLSDNMDVGLATVYRVLTQFEQAGLLNRNHFETGKAIFELNEGSHHDHLVCLDCGRVEEFFDNEIEVRQQNVATERGFKIAEHALAIYGNCVKTACPHRPA